MVGPFQYPASHDCLDSADGEEALNSRDDLTPFRLLWRNMKSNTGIVCEWKALLKCALG